MSGIIYVLVLISVCAMSGAQLLLKKGLLQVGQAPTSLSEIGSFFLKAYSNVYIIFAVVLTVVTALAWLMAVSKTQLSQVYPFMALSYVLVALFSYLLFKEDVTILRCAGILLICAGVILVARS